MTSSAWSVPSRLAPASCSEAGCRKVALDHFRPHVCVCLCCAIVPGLLCLIPFLPVSNSVIPSKPCWSHSVVLCLNVCVFLCVVPGWCVTSPFCMCLLLLCLFTDSHSNSSTLRVCMYVSVCLLFNVPTCVLLHPLFISGDMENLDGCVEAGFYSIF